MSKNLESFMLGLMLGAVFFTIISMIGGRNAGIRIMRDAAVERGYMVPVLDKKEMSITYTWRCDVSPSSGTLVVEGSGE